jgi:hypothetical protein
MTIYIVLAFVVGVFVGVVGMCIVIIGHDKANQGGLE